VPPECSPPASNGQGGVVRQIAEIVRAEGATELMTSHVIGDGAAGFYERLGFVPTGQLDVSGEVILRLALP
jgi:diamine N-acetyltransferase